jgi:hypothetical protein
MENGSTLLFDAGSRVRRGGTRRDARPRHVPELLSRQPRPIRRPFNSAALDDAARIRIRRTHYDMETT